MSMQNQNILETVLLEPRKVAMKENLAAVTMSLCEEPIIESVPFSASEGKEAVV